MTPASMPLPIAATPPSQQVKPSPADRGPPAPTPKRPFAEMLQQSRGEATAPVPKAPPPAASTPTDDAADAGDGDDAAPAKSPPLRPRLRAGGATTTCSASTETASAATAAEAAIGEHDDDKRDGRGLAAAPATAEPWRAMAAATVDAGRAAASASTARTAADAAEAAAGDDATASLQSTSLRRPSGRDDAVAAGRSEAAKDVVTAAVPTASAVAGQASPPVAAPTSGNGHDHGLSAAAALAATPAAAAPADAAPAATAPLALATPVDSPDFAAALGLQVSLLVKDGVQQAELHLNPTDLGPVSIHIAMAGSEARIDFGADLAATRHAIEQGLPELAGALRDAGFTLAGGGVSQHAGERRGEDGGGSAGARRQVARVATPAEAPALLRAARAAGAGGVDLYA